MKTGAINAVGFFVYDENRNLLEGGTASFHKLRNAIVVTIRILRQDAAKNMLESCPPGGYWIIDAFSNGRIEIITGEMDNSIPYSAITDLVDTLRERFHVPLIAEPVKSRTIAVTPNPAKS